MREKLKTLLEMFRIYRSGTNVGDIAALKLTLLGRREKKSLFTDGVLRTRKQNFSPIDIDHLASYPKETFGYAFASFMRRNGLRPLNLSARVEPLFERYPVSLRYVRVHDMFHVLLGFETDIPGELGVYAFIGAQQYNDTLNGAARTARRVGRLMFWARRAIRDAQARGAALAEGAPPLIAEPLEDMLDQPLERVRRELGLV